MGAARQPDQMRGCHCCLQAGYQALPLLPGAATADRHSRRATADPADGLHGRGGLVVVLVLLLSL